MGIIKKLPTNQRPREKGLLYGIESLTNDELLAVIISTGNRNQDALELAHNIMQECISLDNLQNKSIQELENINGIKAVKAIKIKAVFELSRRVNLEKNQNIIRITQINEAARYIKHYVDDNKYEKLYLMLLDNQFNLIGFKIKTIGTACNVIVSPKEIIQEAVKGGAKRIIVAHNHPSNVAKPSMADKEENNKIIMMSALMGIDFMDHLIITNNQFYSFTEDNILEY